MTKHTQERLIDKVRKILALASDEAAPEGERDAALEAAQRIMLEHGLEMAQIEESQRDDQVSKHALNEEQLSPEENELLWAIAQASFCNGWRHTSRSRKSTWVLIGRPEHVAYVRELYAYLRQQAAAEIAVNLSKMDKRAQYARMFVQRINAEKDKPLLNSESTEQQWKDGILYAQIELRKAEDSAQLIADTCEIAWNYGAEVRAFVNNGRIAPAIVNNLGIYRRSFYSSFASRVRSRLEEMQRNTVDTMGTSGTDLVFNEWAAVQAWMKKNAPTDLYLNKSERKWSKAGMSDGKAAGDRADISTRNKVRTTTRELTS